MNFAAEAGNSTTSTVALVVSIVAVVMSALSLCWQALAFRLTGARVRVEILAGSRRDEDENTSNFTLNRVPEDDVDWPTAIREHKHQPLVVVRVRNVGRGPVTVMGWGLEADSGFAMWPSAPDVIGKPLPHRLEGAETQVWAMEEVIAFGNLRDIARHMRLVGSTGAFRARVELGNGRKPKSKNRMRIQY